MTDDGDDFADKLRPKQVAALLGISTDTLRRVIARDRTFPAFIDVAPRVRYILRRDLEAWLTRRRVEAFARRDSAGTA